MGYDRRRADHRHPSGIPPMSSTTEFAEGPPLASRRTFLKAAGAATIGSSMAPTILAASDKAESKPPIIVHPHDACFDRDGNIFIVECVPTGRVTKLRRVA